MKIFSINLLLTAMILTNAMSMISGQPVKTAQDYYNQAQIEIQQGNYAAAVKSFGECLRVEPKAFGCRSSRGAVYFTLGDVINARRDLEAAVAAGKIHGAKSPALAEAYNNRGVLNAAEKKYQTAIADFTEAVRLALNEGSFYINRARALCLTGKGKRAEADEDKGSELGAQIDEPCEQDDEISGDNKYEFYLRDANGFRFMTVSVDQKDDLDAKAKEQFGFRAAAAAIDTAHQTLAFAFEDQPKIILWNTNTKIKKGEIKLNKNIDSLEFSPDGKTLAAALESGEVRILDALSGRVLKTFQPSEQLKSALTPLSAIGLNFDESGRLLASADSTGVYQVWNVETGKVFVEGTRGFEEDDSNLRNPVLKLHGKISEMPGWLTDWRLNNHISTVNANGKFIKVHVRADTILFQDADDKDLALLVFTGENSWLIITPQGFFDGSKSVTDKMTMVKNPKLLTAQGASVRYYKPSILKGIIGN